MITDAGHDDACIAAAAPIVTRADERLGGLEGSAPALPQAMTALEEPRGATPDGGPQYRNRYWNLVKNALLVRCIVVIDGNR